MLQMPETERGTDGGATGAYGAAQVVVNREYLDVARKLVSNTKSELRIFAYAWRDYPHKPESKIQSFNVAIAQAVRRGVVVRAIVDNETIYNSLSARGVQCRYVPGNLSMHAKVLAGDRKDILLGSHNLTMRAFEDNIEVSILCHEFEAVEQFCTYFDKLWSTYG